MRDNDYMATEFVNFSKSQNKNTTKKQNQKKPRIIFITELGDQLSLETPKEKQVQKNQVTRHVWHQCQHRTKQIEVRGHLTFERSENSNPKCSTLENVWRTGVLRMGDYKWEGYC